MRARSQKLVTWLLLVATILSGVAPAQPLVLCLEPDGSVVLEAAEPEGCAPCGPEKEGSTGPDARSDACCPCVDIPLPSRGEQPEAKPRVARGPAVPPPLPCAIAVAASPVSEPPRLLPLALPDRGPAPGLASIRTVVLRV